MLKTLTASAALCVLLTASALARGYVYVTNYGDGTISQFRANSNGTLTPLTPPTVKAFPRCHSIVADPKGHFVYALSALSFNRRNCRISQFRIRHNGTLVPLHRATVPLPKIGQSQGPFLMAMEPSGRFIYVPCRDGFIAQFRIKANGSLTPLKPAFTDGGLDGFANDCSVAFDPGNASVYLSQWGHFDQQTVDADIQAFLMRLNGTLRYLPKKRLVMENQPPLGILITRRTHFAYVPLGLTVPVILQFRVQKKGHLLPLNQASVHMTTDILKPLINPNDRYFYVLGQGDTKGDETTYVGRYTIGPNGNLGKYSSQTLPFGIYPFAEAHLAGASFEPHGRFLYLVTPNGVRPFRVKSDGSVASVLPRSIRAGREPLGLAYVQR